MELRKFKRLLIEVSLLPVVGLLLLAVGLYSEISGSNSTVALIQRSDLHINEATETGALLIDEDTGLRGYEETADPAFLQPYYLAHARLQQKLAEFQAVPASSSDQTERLQDILAKHDQWHREFAEPTIAAVRAHGVQSDHAMNLRGKAMMDSIRSDLDAIMATSRRRREARIELWHAQVRRLLIGLFLLAGGLGVALGGFMRSRLHDVSDAYNDSLEMLKRRADELFASEQRLRATLSSIGDGVIACDVLGRVSMMNATALDLTDWSEEDAMGRPLVEVFPTLNEQTQQPEESPMDEVKRLDRVVGLNRHSLLVRRNGTRTPIAETGAPIRNKRREIAGMVLVFRDVTMERRTQEALLANEKLVVAGRLAATIAHEIHNPLDSVSNLLYLMRTGSDEAEAKQFMTMAEQELARVTQISRSMLGLYRESKSPVRIDLRTMLQEILLLMDRRISDLCATVKTELPDAIFVEGFPAELRQVFTNLIGNAAEAAPGGEIIIRLKPQPAGMQPDDQGRDGQDHTGQPMPEGVWVEIADNGPGIPDAIRGHLFEPFFTTKGEQGTGLGLWVSRGIVTKHGGQITIESKDHGSDHGTTVRVLLLSKPTIHQGDR
ncbi:MAG: CHASE3 domain-containing protein [Acidobacteriota bacterium]|nr:CHASE3 domain-containing protein [Acidobacteriota bacterium]